MSVTGLVSQHLLLLPAMILKLKAHIFLMKVNIQTMTTILTNPDTHKNSEAANMTSMTMNSDIYIYDYDYVLTGTVGTLFHFVTLGHDEPVPHEFKKCVVVAEEQQRQ